MTTIITKTRNLIQDLLDTTPKDSFTYYTSKIFTLSEDNASSIKVYVNGVLVADTEYTFDTDTNQLTYTGSLTVGASIIITYSAYLKYADAEIKSYIKAAISYIAVEKYKTFVANSSDLIFPTPSEAEENLLALVASILIKGDIRQYRTPEITIVFQDNDSIEKKIKKSVR